VKSNKASHRADETILHSLGSRRPTRHGSVHGSARRFVKWLDWICSSMDVSFFTCPSANKTWPSSPCKPISAAGSDLRNSWTGWWLGFQRWAPGLLSARFHPHVIASKKAAGLISWGHASSAANRDPMAPSRLPPVLALEITSSTWPASSQWAPDHWLDGSAVGGSLPIRHSAALSASGPGIAFTARHSSAESRAWVWNRISQRRVVPGRTQSSNG
jgi:hypothetical protein